MFGLMRSCGCGVSAEAKRLALNHDAVFLGERLLAPEQVSLPASFTARGHSLRHPKKLSRNCSIRLWQSESIWITPVMG